MLALVGCSSDPTPGGADAGADAEVGGADAALRDCIGTFTIASEADLAPLLDCRSLNGSITVMAPGLNELRLPNLTTVAGGGIQVFESAQLREIDLPALERVARLSIDAPQLEVAELRSLVTAGESLAIGPTGLSDLSGFGCLCASYIEIGPNEQMTAINSAAIEGETVFILNNPKLVDLGEVTATAFVLVNDNAELTAIPDLPITSLQSLVIAGNTKLSSIEGMSQLTTIDRLEIRLNPALTDITHFDALAEVTESLEVRDNPQLPNCQAEALRDQLTTVGTVFLSGNDTGATCP